MDNDLPMTLWLFFFMWKLEDKVKEARDYLLW